MSGLTEEQEQILAQSLKSREKRLERARKESKLVEDKKISPLEYQRRLLAEIELDSRDAVSRIQKRLDTNINIWRRKVGERFRDAATDSPVILERIERLRRHDTHRTSVVLSGNLGVGKTWLAYSYLNQLIKEDIMYPANIIASTETSTLVPIATGGFKRSDLFVELKNPLHKVFFIDDVGQAHYSTETARHEVWYELIDHVYANDLTLILTTNKTFQDATGKLATSSLKKWLGEAAYDRMKYIMGPDGLVVPGAVNRRPEVFKARDKK
jgi:DNA replication protein DnaC